MPTQCWSELERQIRCFPYGERSDVPRLQQVEQKAVGRQRNLGLPNGNAILDAILVWNWKATKVSNSQNDHMISQQVVIFVFVSKMLSFREFIDAWMWIKVPKGREDKRSRRKRYYFLSE